MNLLKTPKIDAYAEQVLSWIGSLFTIGLHIGGWTVWFILGLDLQVLLVIVSLEAIILGILILMGQNSQSRRMENHVKRDLKKSDEVLEKL